MTRRVDQPGPPNAPTPAPVPPPPPSAPAWAVGYVAIRPGDPGGSRPEEVRHGVEVIPGDSEAAALRVGLLFALRKLPPADGWTGHEAVSCPSDARLRPEAEWR